MTDLGAVGVAHRRNTQELRRRGRLLERIVRTEEDVVAARAFEAPVKPSISFTDMVTVSLGGAGTINRIINDKDTTARDGDEVQYLTSGP